MGDREEEERRGDRKGGRNLLIFCHPNIRYKKSTS